MNECIFCKIVKRQIPAQTVYEDEEILAFHDINPVAPIHILVIPKKHIENILNLEEKDAALIGNLHIAVEKVARIKRLDSFRLITNSGEEAGQTVFHLHYHIIAGKNLDKLIP